MARILSRTGSLLHLFSGEGGYFAARPHSRFGVSALLIVKAYRVQPVRHHPQGDP
jgi:hypothetical protein